MLDGTIPKDERAKLTKNFIKLKLLGRPRIYWHDQELVLPRNKTLALLVYLSMQPLSCLRKDIAELLWGTTSSASLRVALSELRTLAGSKYWLECKGQELRVYAESDVMQFETAVRQGRLKDALQLVDDKHNAFMANFEVKKADEFVIWLEHERMRLNELYLTAIQAYIAELEKAEDYEEALKYSQLLLQKDKLNENVWRMMIRLEHKRGNTEEALEKFEQLREILKTELKVEPLAETLELLAEIEQGSLSSAKTAIIIKQAEQIPAKPEQLIGRADLLEAIDNSLKENKCLLLHGFGGSGKTAIVASYANNFLKSNSGNVLWLQAGDDSPESLFDAIAKAFDAGKRLSQDDDKTNTIKKLLNKKIQLFILDDVWNSYTLSKIIEALPNDTALIATSRQRYPRLKRINVGRLERKDSVELVSHYAKLVAAKNALDLTKDKNLDNLCELLGDHAFALRIAGITLAIRNLSCKELLEQISENPHNMKAPSEFAEQGRESVSSLLAVSTQKLSDQAYEALMAFGAMYSSSCSPELLAISIRRKEEEIEDALIDLQKAGLADRQSEAGSDVISYRLHDLVFSFAQANSNLRELTVMNACKSFLKIHKQDFDILDAEINNMLGAVRSAQKYNDTAFVEFMRLLVDGNAYYQARGHSPKSMELLKEAIIRAKKINDLESAHFLLSKLGNSYRELFGDLDKALVAYQEALALAQEMNDYHREAILLTVIGGVRFHQKQDDADEYLEKAYQLAKKHADNLALSQALSHKGHVANSRKDYETSYKYLSEAVDVAKNLIIEEQVSKQEGQKKLFYALLNVGDVEQKIVSFEQALNSRKQALQIAKSADNRLWMAITYLEIGEMYHNVNKRDLAQENYDKALKYYSENNSIAGKEKLIRFLKDNNYSINKQSLAASSN